MRAVKLTTTSGHSWETNINGSDKEIYDYFLNQWFDVGCYPIEKIEKVVSCEILS